MIGFGGRWRMTSAEWASRLSRNGRYLLRLQPRSRAGFDPRQPLKACLPGEWSGLTVRIGERLEVAGVNALARRADARPTGFEATLLPAVDQPCGGADAMEIRDGGWYFVVVCPQCQRRHFVGEAPPPSPPQHRKPYPTQISIDCDCGSHTDHPPERVVRWQVRPPR